MDKKVLLQDLADGLARRRKISKKDADAFVRNVFDLVEESLLADRLVKVKGLGTFKLITVDSRESINVNTGERITIDSHAKITFSPDKALSDHVNRPFADFETVPLYDETRTEDMERIDTPKSEPIEAESISEREELVATETESVAETPVVGEPESVVEEPFVIEPESVVEELVVEKQEKPEPVKEELPVVEEKAVKAPVVEPVVEKTQPAEPQKNSYWWVWLLLILLGVLIAVLGKRMFTNNDSCSQKLAVTCVDSLIVDTLLAEPEPESEPVAPETLAADYPQIENGEYWIVGTKAIVTLQKGDDLTKFALEHYGDKTLINYIIKYNHLTASKASNLFVGDEVKIPELVKKN